jgi:hypothetical protein
MGESDFIYSMTIQAGLVAHPSSLTMGTWALSLDVVPQRSDHPAPWLVQELQTLRLYEGKNQALEL